MPKPTQTPKQDRTNPRGTAKAAARRKGPPLALLVGLAAVVVIGIMVAVKLLNHGSAVVMAAGPVPPALLTSLESIPISEVGAVGAGSAQGTFAHLKGPTLLGKSGLPRILYMGAEYCPYCAAERWGIVIALNRFGRFENLGLSHSATDDVFPGTPTFTFHGASYHSQYVDFTPVEMQTNTKVNGQYPPLETPDASELALLQKYDSPPYVPADAAGSIPFVDIANQYVFSGASFPPDLLAGKTWTQIASRLSDPSSPEARGIVGTADVLTGAICVATGNKPAAVCQVPAIQLIIHTTLTGAH
jgi:hypothetical protein